LANIPLKISIVNKPVFISRVWLATYAGTFEKPHRGFSHSVLLLALAKNLARANHGRSHQQGPAPVTAKVSNIDNNKVLQQF